MNALIRQFAFTPYIDCMVVSKDSDLGEKIKIALKAAPIYLGDSESLVCVLPDSVNSEARITEASEGDKIEINSLSRFTFIKNNSMNEKGVVLYMQDDPCSPEAVLDRYIAPLKQQGDSYSPIESFSFIVTKKCFLIEGKKLKGIFCEPPTEELKKQKTKLTRKKKT